MNLLFLVWRYLRARPLNTVLNIVLLGLGTAVVTILIVIGHQLRDRIDTNARGIDLVVGAKGSPMQLILCNIFHIDFPTGNIKLYEAERIARNRLVKQAIPMALGDSYLGYRIVGTTRAYVEHYGGTLNSGTWWENPMEVTLGSAVARALQLSLGDTFNSSHGMSGDGHSHDAHPFVVKGILAPTQTVVDNLILTSVESIWHVHDLYIAVEAMGALQLPRLINTQTSLQAASPAFETARLFSIIGVGADILEGFAVVLIVISALSIFIALYNSLKERRFDIAIMRSMGASRKRVFLVLLVEGVLLTLLGCSIGLIWGHSVLVAMEIFMETASRSGITGLVFYPEEGILLGGSLLLGSICAMIPAWQAYRVDIAQVLSRQ
jgi:putative ABC transport system permease protein